MDTDFLDFLRKQKSPQESTTEFDNATAEYDHATADHSVVHSHARKQWNHRIDEIARQRNFACIGAAIASGIATLAVGGVIYIGSQSKIVPVLVEVNALGDAVAAKPVSVRPVTDAVKRYQIAEYITNARSVLTDPAGQNRNMTALWAMTDKTSPAANQLQAYFVDDKLPATRARHETVSVEVELATFVGDTWRVEWVETTRDLGGKLITKTKWQATLVTVSVPVLETKDALVNPTGLFVKSIGWGERGGHA